MLFTKAKIYFFVLDATFLLGYTPESLAKVIQYVSADDPNRDGKIFLYHCKKHFN